MALIDNDEKAFRLAKAIISDILLYNAEKIKAGVENDNLFDVLTGELEEGRKLFENRVVPELAQTSYNRALVDVLFKSAGRYPSKIW